MPRVPLLLPILWTLAACDQERSPSRLEPARRSDKAHLYGDPGLVPTVEGERIRREVAIAAEVSDALRMFPDVDDVVVDVELPRTERERPRVTVTGRLTAKASEIAQDRDTTAIIRSIVGDSTRIETVWARVRAPSSPTPERHDDPLTLFAALGLGISIGVTVQRLQIRRRYGSGSPAIPSRGRKSFEG